MAVMAKQGFQPCKSQYKTRFKIWKLRKNERRSQDRVDSDIVLSDMERARRWVEDCRYLNNLTLLDYDEVRDKYPAMRLVS